MTTVGNPFSDSDFAWTPSAVAGTKGEAALAKRAGTGEIMRVELADVSATDYVITVQCLNTDGKYFRRDLRGAWYRDDAAVTEVDAPIGSGDASGNEGGYDAVLDIDDTEVFLTVTGAGQWSAAINRLVTARDPFDPLSVGTPKLWINAAACTVVADVVTAIDDQAEVSSISVSGSPSYTATDADYNGGPTIGFSAGSPGLVVTGHGLTTGAFTVIVVGDGTDAFWMQDANGGTFMNAGGGSGNKLQIAADGATALYAATTAVSGNEGVYAAVFAAPSSSKVYVGSASASTAEVTGTSGSLQNLTSVAITIGNAATPSSGGRMNGRIRHFMIFSGALSPTDVAYLLNGFALESGLPVGA